MRFHAAPVLLLALALALGCASGSLGPSGGAIGSADLLAGAPLGVPPDPPALLAEGEVLALSPEMDRFLALHVERTADDRNRLRQLARAIIGEGDFGLEYDGATHTAAETFRLRRGNCLSFSTMLVAMARRVGLDAFFQEVDVPPDWSAKQDAFLLNRHVNVLVDLGTSGEQVVDFSSEDLRASYDVRVISDERALAHFDNNLGVETMQAGDTPAALAYFGRALAHDRQFAPAWTNLGILYLRHGHSAHAEAAYLQALKADRFDHVAMSNLAGFYEQRGDLERAEGYRRRVIAHRNRNPYYRYQLAREAFLSGDLDAAITHLKFAVREREVEDRFCYLLGLAYLQQGDERAARRWLTRAVELAPDEETKREYAATRDTLLGGGSPHPG